MRSTPILCGLLTLFICSQPLLATNQDAPTPPVVQEIAPDAKQVIERMNRFYKSLDSVKLSAKISITDEMMPNGMTQSSNIALGRPNLLRVLWQPDSGGIDAASDGKELTVAMPLFQLFTTSKAPTNFESLFQPPTDDDSDFSESELTQDPTLNIAMSLFTDSPGTQMLYGIEKVTLSGEEETFNGIEAHKLVLTTEVDPMDMAPNPIANAEVWIAKGDMPWLLGVTPNFPGEMNLTVQITFENWEKGTPEKGYTLDIPDTWTRVDNLMEAVMAKAAEEMGELDMPAGDPGKSPAHPTADMPAPDFTLTTLDGSEEISLSSLKGKVVVLDFWATWCAPCVAGLPTVDEVTKRYADKGVVFYAVDVREKPERVSKFMKKKGWDFPVLLDSEGTAGKAFDVGGIPHSVVIDRDGIIRHVHIGFGGKEALESQLEAELSALTASGGSEK